MAYKIYDYNRYKKLNSVEKSYFNAHRESWYSFFQGMSIDEMYLKMIEKSAFSLVEALNDYTRKIESIIVDLEERINKKFDRVNTIHNNFVTTHNGEIKRLEDKIYGKEHSVNNKTNQIPKSNKNVF